MLCVVRSSPVSTFVQSVRIPAPVALAHAFGRQAQPGVFSRNAPVGDGRGARGVGVQVVGSPEQDSRLLLCEASAVTMRQCFALLGITPLYRI